MRAQQVSRLPHLNFHHLSNKLGFLALASLAMLGGCSQAERGAAPEEDLSTDSMPVEDYTSDDLGVAATEDGLADTSPGSDFSQPYASQVQGADGASDEAAYGQSTPVPQKSLSQSNTWKSNSLDSPRSMQSSAAAKNAVPSISYAESSPSDSAPFSSSPQDRIAETGPFENLPAGSTYSSENGFATVAVFYATDRASNETPLSAYQLQGAKGPVLGLVVIALIFAFMAMVSIFRKGGRSKMGALSSIGAIAAVVMAIAVLKMGIATIEKHGVTYTAERGILQRGIATVTVPDSHQRGKVERPSLLRFEFREDQSKHIVMTSAVEVNEDEFYRRLNTTVSDSPEQELLVFIHGFNVDFDSAVQRTAQLAVDLPFRGVPICYSWPSQGEVLGYTIDENNVAWTVHHLKTFLYELVDQSGAKSINVIAHSMGNRALTSALSEISYETSGPVQAGSDSNALFDRVVLAAPDIDADYFRRDLAPRVLKTADTVTLYASSDDNALIASKQVHGYPRAGESGPQIVIVPGIETIDVTGIDLSLLGHSYYGDSDDMLKDLFQLVHEDLPAAQRALLKARELGGAIYWQLTSETLVGGFAPPVR